MPGLDVNGFVLAISLVVPLGDGEAMRLRGTTAHKNFIECKWAAVDYAMALERAGLGKGAIAKVECLPTLTWLAKFAKPI